MHLTRRNFLRTAGAVGAGFAGLGRRQDAKDAHVSTGSASPKWEALGPLVADPQGILDLPEGFTYTLFSLSGEIMDDGFLVPGRHDGMAAFEGPDGKTILVRNHENLPGKLGGAFGVNNELLDLLDPAKVYDPGDGSTICLGGTTTLIFDTRTQKLEKHWLSLAGTVFNCSGGPTPWGSWISCEENTARAGTGGLLTQDHGFCFEVPASHEGVVDPVPLADMGRFTHESIAVEPTTGIVYMTEDQFDAAFYRFIPRTPGALHEGGTVQALGVKGKDSLDTRNWHELTQFPLRTPLEVRWRDLEDVISPNDDLRKQAFVNGAARFGRGEGIWYGSDHVYFACTAGGRAKTGQIWRYAPSPHEGERRERSDPGRLELFLEPNDSALLENCDNLTVTPWGQLVLCEDGNGTDRLLGVTQDGELFLFGRNAKSAGEFAGATFSPDGSTMFVNMQEDGLTVAITGDWERFQAV